MRIVVGYPPNYAAIRAAFPGAKRPSVAFAYGDTIFSPVGDKLPPSILAHEAVHARQQGGDPEGWWRRYIEDKGFRFDQELEAHRAEYHNAPAQNRHTRRAVLSAIARRLASPLYGRIVSTAEAKRLIAS